MQVVTYLNLQVYLDKIVGPGHNLCDVRFGNENDKLPSSLLFCAMLDLKQNMQILIFNANVVHLNQVQKCAYFYKKYNSFDTDILLIFIVTLIYCYATFIKIISNKININVNNQLKKPLSHRYVIYLVWWITMTHPSQFNTCEDQWFIQMINQHLLCFGGNIESRLWHIK